MKLGAGVRPDGVHYCVWAPACSQVSAHIEPEGSPGNPRIVPLHQSADGTYHGRDCEGTPGDAYGFSLDGAAPLPDPASRAQRETVHGLSIVIDPGVYAWGDKSWKRPAFRDLVIYELHVGTFTPDGTFRSAIEKLPHLAALGVNALELMPIADFPGRRNWGYDGVLIYAPARCYGSPDDLRALVDAAHGHGLAVLLDVVYNHFGPDGNYLARYSPHYFSRRHSTPWGEGFNLDGDFNQPVRRFFLNNPPYWMEEFHVDGFRLDATHAIPDDSSPHLLAEMAAAIHAQGGYAIAEDERNEAAVISPQGWGFDGVWADDFHHSVRVGQSREQSSYFADFTGTAEELADILRHGWLYRGQHSKSKKRPRGTECRHLPPERFIDCIANHDQTGNHALGERPSHRIAPEAWRALSVLLCLTPCTPLLFMGQEWAASTPFLYFADHNEALGRLVSEGRRKEFSSFPEFSDPSRIPDPQAAETFLASKLNWNEIADPKHRSILTLYRECLRLRRKEKCFRPENRASWTVAADASGAECIRLENAACLLIVNLRGAATVPLSGHEKFILSSEEARFGGAGHRSWNEQEIRFTGPEALVFLR